MRTIGYRTKHEPVEFFDEIYSGDLKKCVAEGDYIVSILPRTKNTDDVFTLDTFKAMKSSALFMNIGRGNAVAEGDLIAALKQKVIARAVLDVFKEEPLRADSSLWEVENLDITPHMRDTFYRKRIRHLLKRTTAGLRG